MADSDFAKMMRQIGEEAEAERRAELTAQLRQARWVRIRRYSLWLILLGITIFVFIKRKEVSEEYETMLTKAGLNETNEMAAKFRANLQQIQATAVRRDALLDDPLHSPALINGTPAQAPPAAVKVEAPTNLAR